MKHAFVKTKKPRGQRREAHSLVSKDGYSNVITTLPAISTKPSATTDTSTAATLVDAVRSSLTNFSCSLSLKLLNHTGWLSGECHSRKMLKGERVTLAMLNLPF
jgi:hypothetical protein